MLEALDIHSVAPYRDRPYEWVKATARVAVVAAHPANRRIVDLDRAPADADGTVHFDADVRLVRPTGASNRKVLVVIPNRGMLGGFPLSTGVAPLPGVNEDPDPGDGMLLDQGWTIAWCGWQWDVQRERGWLGIDAPLAAVDPGWMRVEFRPDADQPDHRLSDSSAFMRFRDYPAADLDDPDATLSVRTSPLGAKEVLPRESWRLTDDSRVELDGMFKAFHYYELVYRSAIAPVVGAGLLAVRDVAASLRRSHDAVFAFGISQSGRFLRQFLYDGLNRDEQDQQVFDGVMAHIASARRGEFNCRYGQPALTHPLTPGYGPPYDTAGLLARQRSSGGVPKVMFINSSWEYWRGDGALIHQDAETGADLPDDADGRAYLVSGTDHLGSSPKDLLPVANPFHQVDAMPVLRALFVALDRWVCDGIEPPSSRVPRRGDGTAVTRARLLERFHDAHLPDPDCLPATPRIDPETTSWPLSLGPLTVDLVADVDDTGNERAGIRLPVVHAPRFAYTGWNPRVHVDGLPDVLYEFTGSRLPLQSEAPDDDRSGYEALARAVAHRLVEDRLLLERDVEQTVAEALRAYDTWSASQL